MLALKLILCFIITWTYTDGCLVLEKIAGESAGGYLACPAEGGSNDVSSLEACLQLACDKGANGVNFKGRQCFLKTCRGDNYAWNENTGYNVYAINMCNGDFTLASPQSKGQASGCPLVKSFDKISLEACKQYTCAKGGNAFNFRDNVCYVKRCESEDLKLGSSWGAHDVYSIAPPGKINKCYTKVELASPKSAGKGTDCPYVTEFSDVSLEFCKQYACANNYNAFNFRDNSCSIKQCASLDDLQLTETTGPQDVYTVAKCDTNFKLAFPKKHSKFTDYCGSKILESIKGATLQSCKDYACVKGYNIFNYLDKSCRFVDCDPLDAAIVPFYGEGYEIYIKDRCHANFTLKYPSGDGKSIAGSSSAISKAISDYFSLEMCKQQACIEGYNAFEFSSLVCKLYKLESLENLKLTSNFQGGAYNIYIKDPECAPFILANSKSGNDAKFTLTCNADIIESVKGDSVEDCKKYACAESYNGFTYSDNSCQFVNCENLIAEYMGSYPGFDLYIKDRCHTSFALKYPASDKKDIAGYTSTHRYGGVSIQVCKQYACMGGYNAIAYNPTSLLCNVYKGVSLKYVSVTTGSQDIYIADSR